MLSEALRLLRIFHDIKAKDLATKLDISPSYLSEIENGKKEPPLELIRKYADIFKTTPSSILFFSEDSKSKNEGDKFKNNIRMKIIKFLNDIENSKE